MIWWLAISVARWRLKRSPQSPPGSQYCFCLITESHEKTINFNLNLHAHDQSGPLKSGVLCRTCKCCGQNFCPLRAPPERLIHITDRNCTTTWARLEELKCCIWLDSTSSMVVKNILMRNHRWKCLDAKPSDCVIVRVDNTRKNVCYYSYFFQRRAEFLPLSCSTLFSEKRARSA